MPPRDPMDNLRGPIATPSGIAWSDPLEPPLSVFDDAITPAMITVAVADLAQWYGQLRALGIIPLAPGEQTSNEASRTRKTKRKNQ